MSNSNISRLNKQEHSNSEQFLTDKTNRNNDSDTTIINNEDFIHNNHHHNYREPKHKTQTENLHTSLKKIESNGANEKAKNYQRLSNSINNVFTNLLQELDKQKNKDYAQKLNKSIILQSLYSDEAHENSLLKHQENRLSNSCNVFDKEADETVNVNSPNRSNNYESPLKKTGNDHLRVNNFEDLNALNENDTSLLERYLTNEQMVSFKHSQIESLLRKYQHKNLNIDQDYSIIDYILNQEGISKQTFKQLIREKFYNMDWPDSLLATLHEILNSSLKHEANIKIG